MPADPTITAALRAAAFAACGCGGMCFKTDGAMYCEAREDQAAAAIAAFHTRMAEHYDNLVAFGAPNSATMHRRLAAAVEEAARDV